MENRRLALIALLGVMLFMIYQAWQTDYGKGKPEPLLAPTSITSNADAVVPDVTAGAKTTPPPAAAANTNADSDSPVPVASAQRVRVKTDLMTAEIATTGGELRRVELNKFPLDKHQPDVKLALLDDRDSNHYFTLQSGVVTPQKALTSNQTPYGSAQTDYALVDGVDTLDVPLTASVDGVEITKLYRFHRDSYQVDLVQTVVNHSGQVQNVSPFARWLRTPHAAGIEAPFVHTFLGLGIYEKKTDSDGYRFKKVSFGDLDKKPYESKQTGGWIAMIQHYFVTAIVVPKDETVTLSGKRSTADNTAGYFGQYVGAPHAVADGATQGFTVALYIGPKSQGTLDAVAPGLELTQDYGIWTPIAGPLFWGLKQFHALLGNWGWAIVFLTIVVKGLMYPLSAAQYKSMAKMKKFTPRIAELRERYSDDREKLNRAMMDLYKKEGFNPLAGCWPILVQFPIFISLYNVMLQSVELRQAPFMLWWNDLSAADPYYVLPVMYGFTMWLQQRMSGQTATMDPTQAKIMNVMPIAMTGLFLFFPQGLVLYWFVSNSIGILQQWFISRRYGVPAIAKT
jgi:YidC/Oxa1 family membrane protein insertase